MIIFISGGAKNGKTTLGQDLAVKLAAGGPHYYVATMIPADDEDRERIRRHIEDRDGLGFDTIEVGRGILSSLEKADTAGTFLLDSVTALLLNELFPDPLSCDMDMDAATKCADDIVAFARSVENAVIISDYIFLDAARYDEITETYRKCLADIDRKIAAVSDTVIEVSAGNYYLHKGGWPV